MEPIFGVFLRLLRHLKLKSKIEGRLLVRWPKNSKNGHQTGCRIPQSTKCPALDLPSDFGPIFVKVKQILY